MQKSSGSAPFASSAVESGELQISLLISTVVFAELMNYTSELHARGSIAAVLKRVDIFQGG